jgi:hypothetical protein
VLEDFNVTVNVSESDFAPSVATTDTGPIDDKGTVKLAENPPLAVVVTVEGIVVTTVPLNAIFNVEHGSNPEPTIFTGVPTGPEFGPSAMIGASKDVTVNVFEVELKAWVAFTV